MEDRELCDGMIDSTRKSLYKVGGTAALIKGVLHIIEMLLFTALC
ncbi:MAG: hypothetical protein ABSB29_07565 [Nitrososphaerales archaeon]|jgi:hypothetical protein